MPNLGTTELLIIAVVIMVLFGAKKLPDSARSLGRSMRIFKAETKGLRDDDDLGTARTVPPAAQAPIAPPAAPVVPPASAPPAAPVPERAADGSTPTTP